MPEPKTAWDLTFEFGQIAVGEERWDVGIGVAFIVCGAEAEALTDRLRAIPADAAEQIAVLTAEVKLLRTKLDAARVESAGEQARRMTAGPLRRR